MPAVEQPETHARWTPELHAWLLQASIDAGFDLCGVASIGAPEDPSEVADASRFSKWIEAGHAGQMDYLKRRNDAGRLTRSALQLSMPWARSAIVCALNYNRAAPRSIDPAPSGTGWIARYAWSGRQTETNELLPTDYHDELLARLRRIESALIEQTSCNTRSYVDTGPLLERALAARAGIGWIGKNTCVINQNRGSWLLLGVVVTSLPVAEAAPHFLTPDRCGSCTRCIDACPTHALLGSAIPGSPREMDASRCIAYLTIEKKGAIDESLREPIGRQVFGCDICQDVCPWNRRAPIGVHEGMTPRPELINPALDWLASLDAKEFKRRFKGSPLERTGRKRLHRNVAIAMGNSDDPRFLPQLNQWSQPPATNENKPNNTPPDDPILRETAQWARSQILESHRPK